MFTFSKSKLLSTGIVALIAGAYVAYLGYQSQMDASVIAKDGVEVPGAVSRATSHFSRKGSNKFYLDVNYTQADGAAVSRKFTVTRAYFDSHVANGSVSETNTTVTNPNVTVRYAASKPEASILVGGSPDNDPLLPFGIGIAALGIGMFITSRFLKS